MGLGGFPTAHKLSLGMLGMHGTYAANMGVSEADLLVAVGVRFDDRVTGKLATFAPQAEIIHIDIDPSNIGKVKQPPHFAGVRCQIGIAAHRSETRSPRRCGAQCGQGETRGMVDEADRVARRGAVRV